MAYLSRSYYLGDGATKDFPVDFPYLDRSHIQVYVNGALTTAWTWIDPSHIRITTAPGAGAVVLVKRLTSPNSRLVDYVSPSSLNEDDLDTDSLQGFYLAQEANDQANAGVGDDPATGQFTAANKRIVNLADPIGNQDATTKNWVLTALASPVAQAIAKAAEALQSAINAAASAAAAAASAVVAGNRATDAAGSATAAAGSASTATAKAAEIVTSAQTAATKAGEAASSATAASGYLSTVQGSATAAAGAATAAAGSASTASTKAGEASTSATAAANSATTASTKAGEAATSATAAAGSAITAQGHATAAQGHASTATTKASEASGHATTATTKAGQAASSATAAAGSATTATTKAGEAVGSATAAAASATAAATSESNAFDHAAAAAQSANEAMAAAGGGVSSFNGRGGVVSPQSGDYAADQIAETATHKVMTSAERTKLAGIAAGATANDSDANLKARSNHTGTQAIATISGLQTALDAKATTSYVDTAFDALRNGVSASFDTLSEIASALAAITANGWVSAARIADGAVTYAKLAAATIADTAGLRAGTAAKLVDAATAQAAMAWATLADGTTITVNHNNGCRFTVTTASARTISAQNLKDGLPLIIVFTGNHNHSWSTTYFDFAEVGGVPSSVFAIYKVAGTVRNGKVRVYSVAETAV
ncbi:Phage T7 tail fibre protein [Devosia enhydra]|uniref:Phage T7 tail fibre protein n=1 Tax=Devosia enhydra TaxID=665118 RepID=A0A1K2HTT3_9HYPH|nr:phage tail fiber protein [Devosia enhydra]SFZ81652.1 Phage T7 tail fibre protein [Devosia enhydra]